MRPPSPAPSPPPAAPDPVDIGALIDAERLLTLYQRTPQALVAGILFSALIAWVFSGTAGTATAAAWFGAKLATLAYRTWDWRTHVRARDPRDRVRTQHRRHAIGTLVDGLGWGAAGVIFLPSGDPMLNGVLVAGLVGVASVGVFTLSSHLGDALRFMAGVLVPMMANELLQPYQRSSTVIIGGCSLYLVTLWIESRRAHGHTRELLRLRFENAAIARERERALAVAEDSSRAKSRFLATVSHELRTPLNGILGMTQLLATDAPRPGQRERLEVVRQSADHLLTLIDDLLDISRIEFGRLALQRRPTAVAPLIDHVIGILAPVAAERGLLLHCERAPELPAAALLDAARVRQVLHKLLGNALTFTDHGQVRLRVDWRDAQLQFTVTDSGAGIPPERVGTLFEAFGQGPEARRRSGAGLGLSISRQLARAMGGDVIAHSVPGEGACFVFTVEAPPCALPGPPGEADAAAPPLRFQGDVLVVEDNPVNALVTTSMLNHLGLRCTVAEDGLQALNALGQARADLVLLDCHMPVLDGWATARRWRQREADGLAPPGRLPIIALTANAVAGDRERCLNAGMDDYLAKPFTMDSLAAAVARHLPTQAASPR